ncbi:MAG: UDP-glucose/GDP-mannose dehydrogenase family protein [Planctomycetota bacterium]|jgi:UDPglucose 6-dehydrogenase|nr:UDP-glucose/GDP-mannose dehydrogenase family protein [Planctomycetota bacterium]
MNISLIGAGYVGLVSGAGFAKMGNRVICADQDAEKMDKLNRGVIPIYEPGLEELVREDMEEGALSFTADLGEAVSGSDVCFIAVGTPMGDDGGADLSQVLAAARSIGRHMAGPLIVVDKSTVPVGTAERVREAVAGELAARGKSLAFEVVANPEFLKEGAAVQDFLKPDRVVVGAESDRALALMRELYAPFIRNHDSFIAMDVRSAEMTKYAANAMLACRISFINEMANICERVGADVNRIRLGIGSDSRIGYSFLYPGIGYGGSCFPKDVQALIRTAIGEGYRPELLEAVEGVNRRQRELFVEKIIRRFGRDLKERTFAVWGLAFKPGTDDMRDSPAATIINKLLGLGARIQAYDPKAEAKAREFHFRDAVNIEYLHDKYEALIGADALLLLTEWSEFRQPDFARMGERLRERIIFDGRNQYDRGKMAELRFEYCRI